jgi:transcriptional regulator with XRE-family HTH domain
MQAISASFASDPYNALMPGGRPPSKQASPLGQRIAQARQQAGLSQSELAAKLGVGRSNVAQWERFAVTLKPEQLAALSDALGAPVDAFLGRPAAAKRAGGPVGKAKALFERVSALPRDRQRKILGAVEDMLAAHESRLAS